MRIPRIDRLQLLTHAPPGCTRPQPITSRFRQSLFDPNSPFNNVEGVATANAAQSNGDHLKARVHEQQQQQKQQQFQNDPIFGSSHRATGAGASSAPPFSPSNDTRAARQRKDAAAAAANGAIPRTTSPAAASDFGALAAGLRREMNPHLHPTAHGGNSSGEGSGFGPGSGQSSSSATKVDDEVQSAAYGQKAGKASYSHGEHMLYSRAAS